MAHHAETIRDALTERSFYFAQACDFLICGQKWS
jgi:hypothetical protein